MTNGTMHITLRDAKKLKQYLNGELVEVNLFESKGIDLQVSLSDVHAPTDEEFVALGFLPHSDKVLLKRGGLQLPKLHSSNNIVDNVTLTSNTAYDKLKVLTNATIYPAPQPSEKKMNRMKNLLRTALMHPAHNGNLDDLFQIIRELDADLHGTTLQQKDNELNQGIDGLAEVLTDQGIQPAPIKEILDLANSLPEQQITINQQMSFTPILANTESEFKQMPESENTSWMLYHSEPHCVFCDKPVINSDETSSSHNVSSHEVCAALNISNPNNSYYSMFNALQLHSVIDANTSATDSYINIERDVEKLSQEFKEVFKGLHVNLLLLSKEQDYSKVLYSIHNGYNIATVELLFTRDNKIRINTAVCKNIKQYTNNLIMFHVTEPHYTATHTYSNSDSNFIGDLYRFFYRVFHDHEGILIFDTLPPRLKLNSKVEDNKYLLEPIK